MTAEIQETTKKGKKEISTEIIEKGRLQDDKHIVKRKKKFWKDKKVKKPKTQAAPKDKVDEGDINKSTEGNNRKGKKRSHENDEQIVKKKKKFKKNKKSKKDDTAKEKSEEADNDQSTEENGKGEKRSVENDEQTVKKKKKLKKDKKAKDDTPKGETEQGDLDQSTEENVDEDNENEDGTKKKKGPSKRQLKKEKAELRASEARESSKQETAQKALNYISKWKHAKSEWKFVKVIQIWLINNLLNETYVPEDHFLTILEYFEGCKGFARKQLIDKAMAVVKKAEDNVEEDEEVIETTEYKRARQLLQALPNET